MSRRRSALVLAAGILGAAPAAGGSAGWIEVRSPHFVVVSDAGQKAASRAARQFEQFRAAIRMLWPWARVDPGTPLVIFALRDEAGLKEFLPEYWEKKGGTRPAGVFIRGRDEDYVALRMDAADPHLGQDNPYHILYHEYLHSVLDLNFDRIPLWLGEGLAEFYGATLVRDDGLELGRPIPSHVYRLREARLLPAATLFAVDHSSPEYHERERTSIFYAQSWALVHYLMFDEKAAPEHKLNAFVRQLAEGASDSVAIQRVFGDDTRPLDRALDEYIRKRSLPYRLLKTPVEAANAEVQSRDLSPAEALAARGELHLAMNRTRDARAQLEEALRLEPGLAAAQEAMGVLCYREGGREEARQWLGRAVQQGGGGALAYYLLAILAMDGPKTAEKMASVESNLRRALQLNSQFAPAYALLSEVMAYQGADLATALGLARRAVRLEPASTSHRVSLGRILVQMGRLAEAVAEAERALAGARTDQERELARSLLEAARLPAVTPEAPRAEPLKRSTP